MHTFTKCPMAIVSKKRRRKKNKKKKYVSLDTLNAATVPSCHRENSELVRQ